MTALPTMRQRSARYRPLADRVYAWASHVAPACASSAAPCWAIAAETAAERGSWPSGTWSARSASSSGTCRHAPSHHGMNTGEPIRDVAEQHEDPANGNGTPSPDHSIREVPAEGWQRVHGARVDPHQGEGSRRGPPESTARRTLGQKQRQDREHPVEAESFPKLDADDEPGALGIAQPVTCARVWERRGSEHDVAGRAHRGPAATQTQDAISPSWSESHHALRSVDRQSKRRASGPEGRDLYPHHAQGCGEQLSLRMPDRELAELHRDVPPG